MDFANQPNVPQIQQSSNKIKWVIIIAAIVVLLGLAAWFFLGAKNGKVLGATTSSSGYQAVFLTNGQVYFGKLSDKGGSWIDLSDIYYLQVTQNLQAASGADAAKTANPSSTGSADQNQTNIQLVKLGSELHGPTDTMHIERDKVLFWEDMKDDSKVVTAIKQYKSK